MRRWIAAGVVGLAITGAACGESGAPIGSGGASSSTSSSTSSGTCEPGRQLACACPEGGEGAQICADDGSAWGPCQGCGGSGGGGAGGASTSSSSSSSSSASSSSSGGGCSSPDDCPAPPGPCQVATCSAGACGLGPVPAGTALPSQVSGDCAVMQCDGQGNAANVYDPGDPFDDGNECTVDACAAINVTTSAASPDGTPCDGGDGVCSAKTCYPIIACAINANPNEVYYCDGIDHTPALVKLWWNSPAYHTCTEGGYSPDPCPAGTPCTVFAYNMQFAGTCL